MSEPILSLQWIQTLASTASVETDLAPFYKACMEDPEGMEFYRSEIKALHFSAWPVFSTPYKVNGELMCNSMLTFLLMSQGVPMVDDPRAQNDFPLIKIHKDWMHSDGDEPISRMSMQVVTDLLLGLEWLVFSDLFGEVRTVYFIEEARELFYLVRNRIFVLINNDDLPTGVVDMKDFRTLAKRMVHPELDTRDLDYDSDDGIYAQKAKRLKNDKSRFNIAVGLANNAYLHDMDSMLTHFEKAFIDYDMQPLVEEPQEAPPSLSRFRAWLYDVVSTLDSEACVDAHRFWRENLQVIPSYVRVYKRIYGLQQDVINRRIIVAKNDEFLDQGNCSCVAAIINRPDALNSALLFRLAGDSMFAHLCNQGTTDAKIGIVRTLLQKRTIYRDALRDIWVVKLGSTLVRAESFMHGFCMLRKHMGAEHMMHGLDLSVYDKHF